MNKICTSHEQSKKLIELGIDVNTADMAYWKRSYQPNDYAIMVHHTKELQEGFEAKCIEYIPAWSLTALFKILPYSSRLERGSSTELYCVTLPDELKSSDWYIEPVDAAFEMVVWLLENKYKNK